MSVAPASDAAASEGTDERLKREAIRLYRRYAVEIVEALSFCPYAEKARLDGLTHELVMTERAPSDEAVLERIEEVTDDERIDIGLLILPRVEVSQAELGRWVEGLRKLHRANRGATRLAIEGFHPVAEADVSSAERLTPFVRRTPDPTLQLTRLSSLQDVRRGTPTGTGFIDPSTVDLAELLSRPVKRPLHERIAELNLESVRRLGVEEIERRMHDILRDRDASYRAIDPTIKPWLVA